MSKETILEDVNQIKKYGFSSWVISKLTDFPVEVVDQAKKNGKKKHEEVIAHYQEQASQIREQEQNKK